MTTRIAKSDITDELIKPAISDTNDPTLAGCDLYLGSLAAKYGKTLANIPATLPYDVKELAKIWIGREICRNKAYAQGEAWRGQDTGDAWTQKLKQYNDDFILYESKMTEKTLFGESQTQQAGTCRIGRS